MAQVLIFLFVGILVLMLAIYLFVFFLFLAIYTAPAWIAGSLAGSLIRYSQQERVLSAPDFWDRLLPAVKVRVGESRLTWLLGLEVDSELWKAHERTLGLVGGIATGLVFLILLAQGGAFIAFGKTMAGQGIGLFSQDPRLLSKIGLVVGMVFSLGITTWVVLKVVTEERFYHRIRTRVQERISRLEEAGDCLEELRAGAETLAAHAERLNLEWPTGNPDFIQERIEARKADLLKGALTLEQLFEPDLRQMREEAQRLEAAAAHYDRVVQTVQRVTRELAPMGSRPLLEQIEVLRGAVEVAKQKHLPQREWGAFAARLRDIEAVASQLCNYYRPGTDPGGGDDLAEAYNILGLSPDVDTAQVRRQYRILQKIFHTDRLQGESSEVRAEAEERVKRINWAYDLIIKKGGM